MPTFRTDEVLAEIRECLELGWTGLGYKTLTFEDAWREYTELPHAHFVNSATAGLHVAIRLLKDAHGWRDRDEVITTPLTFVSTNHVLLYEGLVPVFADVDSSLCLDPSSVEERITPRTRAVVYVGMGGNAGQLSALADLCRDRGLRLVLDAAHMAGTSLAGRHVGHESDVAVFSFQAVKNLPTADSGMVCFADATLDREARKWTWLGISKDTYARTLEPGTYRWRYDVEHVGFKYHGNAVLAAMGIVGLRYLDEDNAYRRVLARWYDEALEGVQGIERVPTHPDCIPSRHLYQVLVEHRDEVMAELNRHRIFPGVHYQDNTRYGMYAAGRGTCPVAARASERVISLPLHLRMTQDDVLRVAHGLKVASAEATATMGA